MIRLMSAWVLLLMFLSDMAVGASSIQAFSGRWVGQIAEMPNDSLAADIITIEIHESSGGFDLSWNDLTRNSKGAPKAAPLEARFVATDRKGVFEFAPENGSFLDRMFSSPEKGNPLEGEALLWARIDADILAVYSLTIDDKGGFSLDHYSWTRTDEGLDLHFQEQTEDLGEKFMIKGKLVPAKG